MNGQEWIKDKENRVKLLEGNSGINSKIFIGTMNEYEKALSKGYIKNGTLVVVTKIK